MARRGTLTRERILDVTEELVLERGFSGTRVDAVTDAAGVAKGAFFHHFSSKDELGRALVQRWAERDAAYLAEALARVERLTRDPLQQLLLLVALFEEAATELAADHAGCLYASVTYERGVLDPGTREIVEDSVRLWRARLVARLEGVAARYPPQAEVELDALADQFLVVFEGAYVLARALGEPAILAAQLRQLRNYLELLFTPTAGLSSGTRPSREAQPRARDSLLGGEPERHDRRDGASGVDLQLPT